MKRKAPPQSDDNPATENPLFGKFDEVTNSLVSTHPVKRIQFRKQ